jgi:hypothetical protein
MMDQNGTSGIKKGEKAGKAKRPRARADKPKVRTGCNMCKVRRVKCDENRPAYLRCTKFSMYSIRSPTVDRSGRLM